MREFTNSSCVIECLDALESAQAELERACAHINNLLCVIDAKTAELVQAKNEAEKAKEDRNRCTMIERQKWIPKLKEAQSELARLKEQTRWLPLPEPPKGDAT